MSNKREPQDGQLWPQQAGDSGCLVVPVRQVTDPTVLGVRAASTTENQATLDGQDQHAMPPYIGRRIDGDLRDMLRQSGFVLLIGDSAAGKTRTAYEAVLAVQPDYTLVAPRDREAVPRAIEIAAGLPRCVLWLDDLYRLAGPEGLTNADIVRLLYVSPLEHRVILATMTVSELDKFGDLRDDANRRINQAVLENARFLLVDRRFDSEETERAMRLRADPRIAAALRHPEYGVPEYLAAGPPLFDKWRAESRGAGEHARGAALISAAVDCRRAGLYRPLSRDLIERLHYDYLARSGRNTDSAESVESAWAWASLAGSTTAPLTRWGKDDSRYDVFSYLIDEFERQATPADHVPARTLLVALRDADATEAMRIGQTARNYGNYRIALQAFTKAAEDRKDRFGEDNRNTLISRNKVARAMRGLALLHEAEAEQLDILAIQQRVFAPDDPDTLTTRDNLARTWRALGKLDDAEREHRAVLEARTRVLVDPSTGLRGPDHPDTLTSRNNLARVLRALGRFDEAEREHRAVLAARTRILVEPRTRRGDDHPDTLTSRNDLARVLRDLGRLDEAEAEHFIVLLARIRILGEDHPDTLISRADLARVLRDLGRLDEAVTELRMALLGRIRTLGEDHPQTKATRRELAEVEELLAARSRQENVSQAPAEDRGPVGAIPASRIQREPDLLAIGGHWPQVHEIGDPTILGVNSSRPVHLRTEVRSSAQDTNLPYAPRDVDDHLRGMLVESGFFLIVGESGTGKTRTAYEAAVEVLPDHVLVAPSRRAAVATAIDVAAELHKCVLWLDQFYRLAGPEGLTFAHVDRLIGDRRHHRVILATITEADLARFTDRSDSATRQTNRDVIRLAHHIPLTRSWSEAELARLSGLGFDDETISAVRYASGCLPLYLMGGREAFDRWQAERYGGASHARGAALISAVVDCCRAGMLHPPSRSLITDLHSPYLDQHMSPHGPQTLESLDSAWSWATAPGPATAPLALTEYTDAAGGSATHVDVLSYLVDQYERTRAPDRILDSTLEGTLSEADATEAMRIGQTARDYGSFLIALRAFSLAAEDRKERLGADHPDTLAARDKRARAQRFRGHLAEAEAEHRAVATAQERILGDSDPATLTSRDNLARVLRALGRYADAEAEHRDVLVARTRILGADHPDTLTTRNGLARVLSLTGREDEGRSELIAVLEIRTRILGQHHRDTLTTRHDLATVLAKSGRVADAKTEFEEVVADRTQVLGADHPDTQASREALYALTHLSDEQGRAQPGRSARPPKKENRSQA